MTPQEAIEILSHWADRAWIDEHNVTNGKFDDAVILARNALRGISGNKEEIPPKYDAEYLQSKIDAHTKRMEEQGLTSEQMLEECRGGEYLTWQDVKRIVNIADIHINYTEPTTTEEEYYTEVLKRFKEEDERN